ncbi:hypothetical protein P4S72_10685 [Vibrio sp. PP-XX7]
MSLTEDERRDVGYNDDCCDDCCESRSRWGCVPLPSRSLGDQLFAGCIGAESVVVLVLSGLPTWALGETKQKTNRRPPD